MKPYFALLCSIGLALQTLVSTAQDLFKFSQVKNDVEVTIPVPYTPFGNRLEFNRYGDDGSKCVLDASGVLTWIDSQGVVRLLPNTSTAIPLFVTNSECLVWSNRFVDYNSYPSRPNATLVLFRAVAGSSVTSSPVTFQGKEILETAPTTITTGALTFISTTRKDNGEETPGTPSLNSSDDADIRFYRVTFDAGVQFVKALSIPVESVPDFDIGVTGPGVSSIGFGSDGSMAVKIPDVQTNPRLRPAEYEDQYHWFDSQGRSVLLKTAPIPAVVGPPAVVAVPALTESVSQVLFCSDTRLVYVDTAGVIKEQRRSFATGGLIGSPTDISLSTATEKVLDLSNYARVGDQKFIYTLDDDKKTVRTYLLGSTAVLRSTAVLTNAITTSAVTGTVNPADGSALLFDEDSTQLIWLHTGGSGFSAIGTSQSRPLYVTNEQAVIWENAAAQAGGNGTLPNAVVAHFDKVLTRTVVSTTGTNLLNTSRITPDFENWLITTSRKTDADTSLLTTYNLGTTEFVDDDRDRLSNAEEITPPATRPFPTSKTDIGDPDTDGDGIFDGLEVHPFRIVTGNFTYEEARLDAIRRGGRLTVLDTSAKVDQLKKQLLSENSGRRLWLGGGDMEGGTEPANSREGNYQWLDAFGRLFNTAGVRTTVPITVFNWGTGQPSNTGNADGLQLEENYKWSLAPVSQRQGYVLEYSATNPTVADTDGDGLTDGSEITSGTNPGSADTDGDGLTDSSEITGGTSPVLADTDGDGLIDSVEKTLGTNPLLVDSDGDGLTDGVEVNGPGFTSNPLLVDTDFDGASDFDEKNAVPPTDPRNVSSVPVLPPLEPRHNRPVTYQSPQTVTIPSAFAPFGQRPDTDKIGDDGSAAFRDRNGVLIWADKLGKAVLIPNSSQAKTLYVSNTECVVYANRYAAGYDTWDSVSNLIIYRRATDGTVTASPTIEVRGTVLDTCPVTPNSYGFTIIAGYGWNYSITDSRQRYQTGSDARGPIYDTVSVDQWHNINYEQYRITWDAALQSLNFATVSVPKTNTNLGGTRILGYGDDGSVAFVNDFVALDFYDDVDDGDPGVFKTGQMTLWATWQINSEIIARTAASGREVREVAYVSNNRLLLEEAVVNESTGLETGNYQILDFRLGSNGLLDINGSSPLPAGHSVLPVSTYTRTGFPAFVYTINTEGTQIQLNRHDDTLIPLGGAAPLPGKVIASSSFVRNPRDGSLLIKSTGAAGVLWIPSTGYTPTTPATGLGAAKSLPNSTQALPMFVSSSEAVAWMNHSASVDLGAGGVLPLAQISHFSKSSASSVITTKSLTPPIVGRYVALPSPLTPDPDSEGWFINTFEKTSDRAALILSYQLLEQDTDGDGLSDRLEDFYDTNPLLIDTDGDGLNDGSEIVRGTDPKLIDSDSDGLADGNEVARGTDPLVKDTDGDGRLDGAEVDAATDPLKFDEPDADGDGVSDEDESEILLTDPVTPSFGPGTGTEAIPFSNSLVSGDYSGLVFDPKSGQSFKQNLRLSAKGSFSSSLLGLVVDSSFKGTFSSTGAFTAPNPTSGLISVQMNLVKQGVNKYYIEGNFKTRTGGTLYFQLRHTLYSKSAAYPSAGKVTFEASLSASGSGPAGSAVATGSISASGQVAFKIYLPDGSSSSYSAPIVDGDLIPLFSRSSSKARTALLGALKLEDLTGQSDFNGSVRMFSAAGASGSLFPSGFDQLRELTGSRFYPPATGVLPLASFAPSANNSVFNWLGGNFDGVQKVGTWAANGKMTIPPTQNDKAKATFTSSSGLLTLSYTRTDATRNLFNSTAKGYAVVVQKSKTFKGYYTSGLSAGDFEVVANTSGINPEITSVSPLNKSVRAAATSYTVTVGTAGIWDVVFPSSVNWLTATVSSAAGETGSSLTTPGNGNGTVVINVTQNVTNARREAEITIAGVKHTLKQEFN